MVEIKNKTFAQPTIISNTRIFINFWVKNGEQWSSRSLGSVGGAKKPGMNKKNFIPLAPGATFRDGREEIYVGLCNNSLFINCLFWHRLRWRHWLWSFYKSVFTSVALTSLHLISCLILKSNTSIIEYDKSFHHVIRKMVINYFQLRRRVFLYAKWQDFFF